MSADVGTAISDLFQQSGPDGRRIGRRVPTTGLSFSWQPATSRSRRRKAAGALAQVIDLSITGARVTVEGDRWLHVGTSVRIGMDSGAGTCVVRRVDAGGDHETVYGIEFVWLDQELNERIHDLVVGDRGSLDEAWRHVR